MKFFAATLLAVAAAAVKINQEDAEMPPKCPPPPSEDADAEDIFDMIDADGSGDIDEDEGLAALICAGEYGMIDDEDVDAAVKLFKESAGKDGKLDKEEAKKAAKKAMEMMSSSGDEGEELAQKPPKGDGPGSDSGSDSGPDSEDLKAAADELDLASEDVDALLDGELAQKPPKGDGSGSGSGPELDSEDLEGLADAIGSDMELAQKKGEGSGSGSGPDLDSEDLEGLADAIGSDLDLAQKSGRGSGSGSGSGPDLDSEDVEALLDGEFAQKSGPPKGDGSGSGSGPDLDSEDLEALADAVGSDLDLAQEEGKPKKCPKKEDMEAVETDKIFDLVDQDGSGEVDMAEGKFALDCIVKAELMTQADADAIGAYLEGYAGEDKKLSKAEAEAAIADAEA